MNFYQPLLKRLFLIVPVLFILLVPFVNGQKQILDVIYLNSGEVYRGHLKEHVNPDLIRLETICLNTRIFSRNEIIKIESEKVNLRGFLMAEELKVQGYFNRTDIGAIIGSGNNHNVLFSIQMVNGYKVGTKYHPGIGIGLEFYEYAVLPLFADFTYVPAKGKVSPFFRGSFGYSFSLEDPGGFWGVDVDNLGGLLFGAGVGTAIRTGKSSALVFSLVYRFQSLKSVYTEEWTGDVVNLEKQFNRIAIRIGFMFD